MDKQTNKKKWKEMEIVRGRLIPLWKLYIGEFFHNDKKLWSTLREPYIYYKHLFRKFAHTKVWTKERLRDLEEIVVSTRPNNDTIYNSLEKDPNYFKLTQKELTDCLTFLNKYYNVNLGQHLKTKIMEVKNQGYTTEDIARHCRVHEDVIIDVLNNKEISYNNIKQIETELSDEK